MTQVTDEEIHSTRAGKGRSAAMLKRYGKGENLMQRGQDNKAQLEMLGEREREMYWMEQ